MPLDLIQNLARLSDHRGAYTNLSLPWAIETTGEERCPLHRCHWPDDSFTWTEIARPGGYRMIVLEEMAAQAWSLEERLKRPADFGCRCLQGCDSASGTGALLKGRSSSRLVNEFCERVCAINVAGDLSPFYSWLPTDRNPADAPSSRFGIRTAPSSQPLPFYEHRHVSKHMNVKKSESVFDVKGGQILILHLFRAAA